MYRFCYGICICIYVYVLYKDIIFLFLDIFLFIFCKKFGFEIDCCFFCLIRIRVFFILEKFIVFFCNKLYNIYNIVFEMIRMDLWLFYLVYRCNLILYICIIFL